MAAKKQENSLLRDSGFKDYGTAKVDAKHRIVIKGAIEQHYKIYRNSAGQILLDPQVMIPAREAWLYKNKEALASVRHGLQQAGEGKLLDLGSFAKYADDEIDD